MLVDENVLPEEIDEGFTEKLLSKGGVVLLENEDQRMLHLVLVLRPLGNAREENDKHLLDGLIVKETAGDSYAFDHEFGNLINVVGVLPVLEPFLVMILLELLSEDGPESSQNRLVECVNLD